MTELLWEESAVQPGGRFHAHVGTLGKVGIIQYDDSSWHVFNLPLGGHVSERIPLKATTAAFAKVEATQLVVERLLEVRRRIDLALVECGQ